MSERVFRPKFRNWREYEQRRDERVQVLDTGKIYTALLRVSGRSWEALECSATIQAIDQIDGNNVATVSVLHQDDFLPLTKTNGIVISSLWYPATKQLTFVNEGKDKHYATEGYFLEYEDGVDTSLLIEHELIGSRPL